MNLSPAHFWPKIRLIWFVNVYTTALLGQSLMNTLLLWKNICCYFTMNDLCKTSLDVCALKYILLNIFLLEQPSLEIKINQVCCWKVSFEMTICWDSLWQKIGLLLCILTTAFIVLYQQHVTYRARFNENEIDYLFFFLFVTPTTKVASHLQ